MRSEEDALSTYLPGSLKIATPGPIVSADRGIIADVACIALPRGKFHIASRRIPHGVSQNLSRRSIKIAYRFSDVRVLPGMLMSHKLRCKYGGREHPNYNELNVHHEKNP
jgi:hypothetical protein